MKTIATLLALALFGCAHTPAKTQLEKNMDVCKAELETVLKRRGVEGAKVLSCTFNKEQQRVNCVFEVDGQKDELGRHVTPEGACE